MRFRFKRKGLKNLYTDEKGSEKYAPEIVDRFFEVMDVIKAARDERDLRAMKSLHWEKLLGDKKNRYSLRLNKQWRLLATLQQDRQGKYLSVEDIDDYH